MGTVYLMSFPRADWGLRGKANFVSQAASAAPPTAQQAMTDWLELADAVEAAGGHVLVLPPPPVENLTGLPYVAEAGLFFRGPDGRPGMFVPNMKPPHRKAEGTYLAGFFAGLGWETRAVPGLWEGQGDALRIDGERIIHTAGEGAHARTEQHAYSVVGPVASARHLLLRFRADPFFHGNTFLGAYQAADGKRTVVLVCPDALLPGELEKLRAFVTPHHVELLRPEQARAYTTNALQVHGTVVAPTGLDPAVLGLWRELGLVVKELPFPALFRAGGGAAVCLTNRLDGLRPDEIPAGHRYAAQRKRLWKLREGYPA